MKVFILPHYCCSLCGHSLVSTFVDKLARPIEIKMTHLPDLINGCPQADKDFIISVASLEQDI